ncbi:MAG: OmpA family protein [Alloprevotella sp.]|nr:OmpA family protein [Alloprevotella sp.]
MRLKSILAAALAIAMAAPAAAQSRQDENWDKDYKPYPYAFINLQGGAQTTFTNYDFKKLIMPTGAAHIGAMFSPVVGVRAGVSGWRNKGAFRQNDRTYYYNYANYDADVLLNVSNIIWRENYHALNLYVLGGVGLQYAWHNKNVLNMVNAGEVQAPYAWRNRLFHNFRAGAMLEACLSKNIAVNLEVNANNVGDRYNSKTNGHGDWQINALAGLVFKFGHKKNLRPVPVVIPEPEPEPIVVPEPVIVEEPVVEPPKPEPKAVVKRDNVKLHKVIFYAIRVSDNEASSAVMKEVAEFMKKYKDVKVQVVGYADKGTGNAKLNAMYAQKRAENFKEDLVARYGVEADVISTDSKGDTIQPFDENDKNRCVIIDAEGINEYTVYE